MRKQSKPSDPRIAEIMGTFNFTRVLDMMEMFDWTWATSKTSDGIPTMREIRKAARMVLGKVVDNKHCMQYRFGGFVAEKFSNNVLELRFELETAQGFPANFQEEE